MKNYVCTGLMEFSNIRKKDFVILQFNQEKWEKYVYQLKQKLEIPY